MAADHFVPHGWKRVSLHELAHVQTGVAKGKREFTEPIELPYLRVANVQDGRLDLHEIKTITVSKNEVTRYSLQSGDVLMTEGGDFDKLGRGFVWEGQIPNCLHQNHVFAVRPNRDRLDPYFLAYQTASGYGRGYFLNCSKQTTNLASINSTQLKEYPVLLPSAGEQTQIVSIIRCWDQGIEIAERLLSGKLVLRQGLMQQLLTGRRRLPRFSSSWRTVRLGRIFRERLETNRADLPLLSITTLEGVIPRAGVDRKDTSSENKSAYLRICPGDIGYNTMRMWQGVSGLSQLEGIISPAYTVITPDSSIDAEFMAVLFKYQPLVHLFWRYSQGMVDDTLNLKFTNLAKIKVTIPEKEEQTAIAGVFRLADREIALLRYELAALQEQKKGLMQQLLTGKRRVNVPVAA